MDEPRRTTAETVYDWRLEEALRFGFCQDEAHVVAGSPVDLHQLEQLIDGGCSPATAFEILR
jgi:hypothetical protein